MSSLSYPVDESHNQFAQLDVILVAQVRHEKADGRFVYKDAQLENLVCRLGRYRLLQVIVAGLAAFSLTFWCGIFTLL